MLKSTFSGIKLVLIADNTGLSSFVLQLLHPKSVKSHEILQKFKLIAVQDHLRSSHVIYIQLEIKFYGLQFRCRQYGSIFIHLAVVCSQIYEILRNSERIRAYSRPRSYKVIDLGVNREHICNFL